MPDELAGIGGDIPSVPGTEYLARRIDFARVSLLRRRCDDCTYRRSCPCADASQYPTIESCREVIEDRVVARQIANQKTGAETGQGAKYHRVTSDPAALLLWRLLARTSDRDRDGDRTCEPTWFALNWSIQLPGSQCLVDNDRSSPKACHHRLGRSHDRLAFSSQWQHRH
jgi:hypothetical protein